MPILDDNFIKNGIQIPENRYALYEDELFTKFFFVRVSPKGKIVALVKWTMSDGTRKEKTLGVVYRHYPMMSTYRAQAKDILNTLVTSSFSIDPFENEKSAKDKGTLFRVVVKKWVDSTFPEKSKTTKDTESRYLCNDILPHFSKKSHKIKAASLGSLLEMDTIGDLDIMNMDFMVLSSLKGQLAQTPFKADRIISIVNAIMNFAVNDLRIISVNPFNGIKQYRKKTDVPYITTDQVKSINAELKSTDHMQGAHTLSYAKSEQSSIAYQLKSLTGVRGGQLFSIKISDIDFENSILSLSAKTSKNKKQNFVYLSEKSITLIIKLLDKHQSEFGIVSDVLRVLKARNEVSNLQLYQEIGVNPFRAIYLLKNQGFEIFSRRKHTSNSVVRVFSLGKGSRNKSLKEFKPEFLFPSYENPSINQKSARKTWSGAVKRTGLTHMTPHKFRHAIANAMLMDGASIDVAQQALTHDDRETTEIYAKRVINQELKDRLENFSEKVM